jgi:putative NIF3 family GTP cyclohydrolase 1 type 2
MKSDELIKIIDNDFILDGMWDDFAEYIPSLHPYMTEAYKKRSMGLVCGFAQDIGRVYTAVFPSDAVMEQIMEDNSMLFLHHPAVWDYRGSDRRWFEMSDKWAEICKERRISIYSLHVPLDYFGDFSTSASLAREMGLEIVEPFCEYRGGLAGVICRTKSPTMADLREVYASTVGHGVSLYPYGEQAIRGGVVAVVAGGGNDMDVLPQVHEKGVNVLITGLSMHNARTTPVHQYEKDNRINLLGGTHYSSEKFACINICKYFRKLGIPAQFLADKPVMEDL